MDDTIGQYRDGIPNGDDITLLMLANMTSGIARSTMQDEFADALYSDPSRTFTIDELIQIGVDASPSFAPGEGFECSNTNTKCSATSSPRRERDAQLTTLAGTCPAPYRAAGAAVQ